MAMSKMDVQELATKTRDFIRVNAAHHHQYFSGEDLDAIGNFVLNTLSKYEDNGLMQMSQYNPQTNRVETLGNV